MKQFTTMICICTFLHMTGVALSFTDSDWVAMNDSAKTRINGAVTALAAKDGDLYVSGNFTQIEGQPFNHIAKWDGQNWSALGEGLNQGALELVFKGNELYAGGSFTEAGGNPANRIAMWDGASWNTLGSGIPDDATSSITSRVEAIATDGTNVFVGGFFETAGGVSVNHIARWDGVNWHSLGTGIDDYLDPNQQPIQRVRGLFCHEGSLYIAGSILSAGGVSGGLFYRWDGSTFHTLGQGRLDYFDSSYAYTFYQGRLFVGTTLSHGYWWWDDGAWHQPWNDPMGVNSPVGLGAESITHFAQSKGDLFVAGSFFGTRILDSPAIAVYRDGSWQSIGSGIRNLPPMSPYFGFSEVYDIAIVGNHLYVGGNFNYAGDKHSPYLARAWIGKPTEPISPQVIADASLAEVRLVFESRPGHSFDIFRTTDLDLGFGALPIASGVEAHPTAALTTVIDSAPPPNRAFYLVIRR